jgi:hypothetical protein
VGKERICIGAHSDWLKKKKLSLPCLRPSLMGPIHLKNSVTCVTLCHSVTHFMSIRLVPKSAFQAFGRLLRKKHVDLVLLSAQAGN